MQVKRKTVLISPKVVENSFQLFEEELCNLDKANCKTWHRYDLVTQTVDWSANNRVFTVTFVIVKKILNTFICSCFYYRGILMLSNFGSRVYYMPRNKGII